MALTIRGLAEWRERLANLRAEEVMARALADSAERLADAVRDGLSEPPGGTHDRPWERTGALRDSIGAQSEGLQAVVGSSDKAAVPQEMGTATIPPRPFLAPVAAAQGEAIAKAVGDALVPALRGEPIATENSTSISSSAHGVSGSGVATGNGSAALSAAPGTNSALRQQPPFVELVGDWTR